MDPILLHAVRALTLIAKMSETDSPDPALPPRVARKALRHLYRQLNMAMPLYLTHEEL